MAYTKDKLECRQKAIEMFLAGHSIAEIARRIRRTSRCVSKYIEETRRDLLKSKADYFDYQVSCVLEQKLEFLQEALGLLSDREFLRLSRNSRG